MPRYYIDVDLDDAVVRDQDGADYPDLTAARQEALGTLADISKVKLGDGKMHDFSGSVRNEEGTIVFKASLSLTFGKV